uniref:Putative tick metalloprotease 1 n=1 Tax=Amblyomma cajennense TaxID=34607 RepID=A0A023FSQ7_AMBCJ
MALKIVVILSLLSLQSLHAAIVPEHAAVVYPQLFDVRDDLGTRVLRVNDKITLNLKKSAVLPDDFVLIEDWEGVPRHTYFNVDALEEDLYHDEKHFASVMVSEEDGSWKVEGVVGPNLKIRPMEEMGRSSEGHYAHLLEPIEKESSDTPTVLGEAIKQPKAAPTERARSLYDIPIIYPEVKVVADATFRSGFKSKTRMMRYLVIEFNVINLRYRTVSQPEIKLIFRSVQITKREKEKYYKFVWEGRNVINGLDSLYALVNFTDGEKKKDYENFDIVFFITGYDMAAVQLPRVEQSLQGYAFVGSACLRTRVGLGEDAAYTYIGIRIIAHEIGHTLGCSHDGTSVQGHIPEFTANSNNCPWEQGYLMSYIEENANSMKFSSCCDYSMSLVAWSTHIKCLHETNSNKTIKSHYNTSKIPGEFLTKDKQCKMTYPTLKRTYFMKEKGIQNCKAWCFVPGDQYNAADHYWPMLLIDGSNCSYPSRWYGRNFEDMVCINGDCVRRRSSYPARPVGK